MRRLPAAALVSLLLALALLVVTGLSACAPGTRQRTGPVITIASRVARSTVIAVVPSGPPNPVIAGLIAATARPSEDVELLQATRPARVLAASMSPAPVRAVVAGRPLPPGSGATSFQLAQYAKRLRLWKALVSARRTAVAAETRAAVTRWARSLFSSPQAGTVSSGQEATSLAAECSIAAAEVAELREAGGSLGGRRVVLLYVSRLDRVRMPGELTGDKVIVLTPFLPSAAATAAAERDLRAAGATWAVVLGTGVPIPQLRRLVTAGLARTTRAQTLSAPALFRNDSAVLRPAAAQVLAPLLGALRHPGATAMIIGYASSPGTARANRRLSEVRASAVARFFAEHHVDPAALTVVGQGATGFVGPGPSAANRRVVVLVTNPLG